MKRTLASLFCSAILLSTGLFASVSNAALVNDGLIETDGVVFDCGFNEAAGTAHNSASLDCGALTGAGVWFTGSTPTTDGNGNMVINAGACGNPNAKYIRTHHVIPDTAPNGGMADMTSTTEITVYEINASFSAPGGATDSWPRAGLYSHPLAQAGNSPDMIENNHAIWFGNGAAPAWSNGTNSSNDISLGHWVFQGHLTDTAAGLVDGQAAGARIIFDTTTDGPSGSTHLSVRYEVNNDVTGSGSWVEHLPVAGPGGTDYTSSLLEAVRANGTHALPGGYPNVFISNNDCGAADMLVDRARVYRVSALVPVELSGFSID